MCYNGVTQSQTTALMWGICGYREIPVFTGYTLVKNGVNQSQRFELPLFSNDYISTEHICLSQWWETRFKISFTTLKTN